MRIPGISPADNRLLEAAVAAGADCIVSNDRQLLALGSYHGVRVLTPSQFLALLQNQGG